MNPRALELAARALEPGYERDPAGELRARDPDPRDVRTPAFHLVRTAEGNRWLVSGALPPAVQAALEAALRAEPVVPLAALERTRLRLEAALSRCLPAATLHRGPAYVFPEVIPPPAVAVERLADPRTCRTVAQLDWLRSAAAAAHPLCVARNVAGEVLAVCHSSRSIATAAAAGVETADGHRGRGLGTAVVAGCAAAVRAEGRVPHYGTSWDNAASRAIARKLGLVPSGEEVHPL